MKKKILRSGRILLFLFFSLFSMLSAREETVSKVYGKIDTVTVYSDRAIVQRSHPVKLHGAQGSIRFNDLPHRINKSSIRASGRNISISGVSIRNIENDTDDPYENHPLKIKIKDLKQKIQIQKDNLNNFASQLNLMNSFAELSARQSEKEVLTNTINVQNWSAAVNFIEKKRSHYQNEKRLTMILVTELEKELKKATAKFNEEMQGKNSAAIEVEVTYTGETGNSGSVILEYMVTGVSWAAIYDLRGLSENGDFNLVTHATIRQDTGENWENVSLTLSTAKPAVGTAPGILQPWRVSADNIKGMESGNSVSGKTAKEKSGRMDFEDMQDAEPEISNTAESTEVTVKIPTRETISSDSAEHRVRLSETALKGLLSYIAIPSISSFVYLKARVKNTGPMPLVSGNMNIFLDGNYIGSKYLYSRAAVGEEFDIFLGPDRRLQIKRELLRGDIVGSGIIDKKVEVLNQWQIEISNYTNRTRKIDVYDQYPVPADPNVQTNFIGSSRKDVIKNANGILKWQQEIAPGKTNKFDFSYSIAFPQNIWNTFLEKLQPEIYESPEQAMPPSPSAPKKQRMYNLEQMMK